MKKTNPYILYPKSALSAFLISYITGSLLSDEKGTLLFIMPPLFSS